MRLILKTAILRAGVSQRRIAVVCGISENRFSEIVCGWTLPGPEERTRIATFLGTVPDHLFDIDQPDQIVERSR